MFEKLKLAFAMLWTSFAEHQRTYRNSGMLKTIVGLVIGVIFISFLVPVAFNTFYATDTDNWTDASVVSLWGLIPIFVIIGLVVLVIGYAIKEYVL